MSDKLRQFIEKRNSINAGKIQKLHELIQEALEAGVPVNIQSRTNWGYEQIVNYFQKRHPTVAKELMSAWKPNAKIRETHLLIHINDLMLPLYNGMEKWILSDSSPG